MRIFVHVFNLMWLSFLLICVFCAKEMELDLRVCDSKYFFCPSPAPHLLPSLTDPHIKGKSFLQTIYGFANGFCIPDTNHSKTSISKR